MKKCKRASKDELRPECKSSDFSCADGTWQIREAHERGVEHSSSHAGSGRGFPKRGCGE